MANVNKATVVARAAKPFGQRGGNTVYIEETLANGTKAIRFKINFRQDGSARPSTIVAHAEKPAGLQNISEAEYRNLIQILWEGEEGEAIEAEAGEAMEAVGDIESVTGDPEAEVQAVADTTFEELLDSVEEDGQVETGEIADHRQRQGQRISEARWAKLAGLLKD